MKRFNIRALALALSLVLLISVFPMSVFAASGDLRVIKDAPAWYYGDGGTELNRNIYADTTLEILLRPTAIGVEAATPSEPFVAKTDFSGVNTNTLKTHFIEARLIKGAGFDNVFSNVQYVASDGINPSKILVTVNPAIDPDVTGIEAAYDFSLYLSEMTAETQADPSSSEVPDAQSAITQFTGKIIKKPVNTSAGRKITGVSATETLGSYVYLNGRHVADPSGLTVYAGDEILIPILSQMFTWDGAVSADQPVSKSQLNSAKITYSGPTKVSGVIEKIELIGDNSNSYIKVQFVKNFVSTAERKFNARLQLAVDKRGISSTQVQLEGYIENEVLQISDDSELDISYGAVIEPDSTVRDVVMHIGDGMYIKSNLRKGSKYYAMAVTDDMSKTDEDIMLEFYDIAYVYTVGYKGFVPEQTRVAWDVGGKLYVYNSQGEFVGRTDDDFKGDMTLAEKFYLAESDLGDELAMYIQGDDYIGPDDLELSEVDSGDIYGDDGENYNPTTGR